MPGTRGVFVLLCLTLLLLRIDVTVASPPAWDAPTWDGILRVAIGTDIKSLNAGVKRDANTDVVLHHVLEALVAYREDLTIAPMLAESVEVSEDGRIYKFFLREGVTFHNGVEMTSEHVKWSWQRYLDPDTRWRCRSWYDGSYSYSSNIESIETPAKYQVVFTLTAPSAVFLHRMANLQCISGIIHPDSEPASGSQFKPIGTGPYKIGYWRRGEFVELDRYKHYKKSVHATDGLAGSKRAVAEKIRFIVIPDVSVAKSAVLSRDIDVVIKMPITLYPEFKQTTKAKVLVQDVLDWVTLLIQTDDRLLSNLNIRKAIAHAIDREKLTEYATQGFGEKNSSAIPDKNPFYTAHHKLWYRYDPELAKQHLNKANYKGEVIKIQTNKKQVHLYDNAIILQAMLRDVGMNVELEVLDWATQLNNFYSGNFQLSSFDYSARTEPYLNYLVFTGRKSQNKSDQWDSQDALDILAKTELTADVTKRADLFAELHSMMKNEIPIIGLYNTRQLLVMGNDVHGLQGSILGIVRLWNVYKKADAPMDNGEL